MPTIFLSYARQDAALAQLLANDLDELGNTVWLDKELSGAQPWWDRILEQIRLCDVFVYALSPAARDSLACQRESEYAAALAKLILPVLVSGDDPRSLLSPALAAIQYVDYREQTREASLRLARAIFTLPPPSLLPNPLPEPPPAPIPYIYQLAAQIRGDAPLSDARQSHLVIDLRRSLNAPETAELARELLTHLRDRRDLLARIADDIDETLGIRGQRLAAERQRRIEELEAELIKTQEVLAEAQTARDQLQQERDELHEQVITLKAELAGAAQQVNQSLPPSAPDVETHGIGMEFVLIPAGTFQMGSDDGSSDEKPVHQVTISQPFYLGKYVVTQAQWKQVMGSDKNPSERKGDELPVTNVSWQDAQAFIEKLNASGDGSLYRLPTEAEWEYAARAGTTTVYSFGDDPKLLDQHGWYEGNSGKNVQAVGQLKPNPWGLYDMHGNVWEWVEDWYGAYSSDAQTDPKGPQNEDLRVLRGGSFGSSPVDLRSAVRFFIQPEFRGEVVGFRCLRVPQP